MAAFASSSTSNSTLSLSDEMDLLCKRRKLSTLKLKTLDRRSCLSENHLDDLMRISVDGPPMSGWIQMVLFSYGGQKNNDGLQDQSQVI